MNKHESFESIQNHQASILLHCILRDDVSRCISPNRRNHIIFLWIVLSRNSSSTKTTDSMFKVIRIRLEHDIVLNLKDIKFTQIPLRNLPCLLLGKKFRSCPAEKSLLLPLNKSLQARKFCFSICFLSFFPFRSLFYLNDY